MSIVGTDQGSDNPVQLPSYARGPQEGDIRYGHLTTFWGVTTMCRSVSGVFT
jgi:hypothetical protein